jgi:monooxygenase
MFKAIRKGSASVVTEEIDCFTDSGIRLQSGRELSADIIVAATGLKLQFLSDIVFTVDGKTLEPNKALSYKGMMISDVPNMAISMGYTNASWTLKCDLTCDYVCRLLNFMDAHGHNICMPSNKDPDLAIEPYMSLSAGYIQRSQQLFPQQGTVPPWKLYQSYFKDLFMLRYSSLEDDIMEFS